MKASWERFKLKAKDAFAGRKQQQQGERSSITESRRSTTSHAAVPPLPAAAAAAFETAGHLAPPENRNALSRPRKPGKGVLALMR